MSKDVDSRERLHGKLPDPVQLSVRLQENQPFWRRWAQIATEGQAETLRLYNKRWDEYAAMK